MAKTSVKKIYRKNNPKKGATLEKAVKMKGNKASNKNLRKPAKGVLKSKKDTPDIPQSRVRNPKSKIQNPQSMLRNPQFGIRCSPERGGGNIKIKKGVPDRISDMDLPELLHEFLVSHAELEIQNEELRAVQRRLEESQSKYVDLYDFAPIGYFTFDKHGTILDVNLTGAQLLGIERRRLARKPFSLRISSLHKNVFLAHLKKVFESKTKQTSELKLIRKDGTQFFAYLESIAVSDNSGNHICRTAISDITKQKWAEDEMNRFASFPKLDPNPVIEVDSSGKITFRNDAALRTLEKLEFQDVNLFLPSDMSSILSALKEKKDSQFYRTVSIRDRIFAESLYATPQYNSIRIYVTDITERWRAEHALRISEEYFRLLMENASDAVTILEGDGTIRYESLSVERMLGYKPEELVGTNAFDLLHPDDVPNAEDVLSQLLQKPELNLYAEFRCRHKDGSWRILGTTGRNFLDHPVIKGVIVNSRDITKRVQAEVAVQSERQKLINIVDAMVDGVYIVDQKYNVEYVNPEIEREYGPVNGRSCYEYFEGQEKACTWCKNEEVFKGKTVRWEWYSEKTNKTYDLINTPLKNPDGSVSKLGIFRDISERKQAEERLYKLNRTLRALSNSRQAMIRAESESEFLKEVCEIVVRDCGHTMVWIGFAEDDEDKTVRPVANAGFEEGYLETLNITWADTELGRGSTGTAIRTGKPSICKNMLTDPAFEPWRKEAIKLGYASSIVLPLMENGKAFGAISIYSREPDPFTEDEVKLVSELAGDLSYGILAMRTRVAHAKEEQAIRQKEARLATFASATFEGIVYSREGRIMDCNDQFALMLGYTVAELLGREIADLLAPEDLDRVMANIRLGRPSEIEHAAIRKDGSRMIVEAHGRPDPDGPRGNRMTVLRDITERKRAEEELKKSREELAQRNTELEIVNRELEAFSHTVSHDLKNPLRSIQGFAQAMTEDYKDRLDDEGRDFLRRITSAGERMTQLIDSMMEIVRLTSRYILGRSVDLSLMAKVIAYELKKNEPDRQVDFVIAKGIRARADVDMLEIVLRNLFDNSWKFTSKHTSAKIEFGITNIDGQTVYFVRDDGAGFDMEFADNLFMPFKRLHSAAEFPGLGIGLATARKIINEHGGKIWAESEPEKGATFYFTLK